MELHRIGSGRILAGFAAALVVCALVGGCQFFTRPPDLDSTEITDPKTNADVAAEKKILDKSAAEQFAVALASDAWILGVALKPGETPSEYHFRHPELEQAATLSSNSRTALRTALTQPNSVVATNAAILLARQGDDAVVPRLLAAVSDARLKMPLRRAAAESLAGLKKTPVPSIHSALAQVGDSRGEKSAAYQGDLHAELLTALAKHVPAHADPAFTAALLSPAVPAQLVALAHWSVPSDKPLPREARELLESPNPILRKGAIQALAAHPDDKTEETLLLSLRDPHLQVRLAAIAGLGTTGGDAAQQALAELFARDGEVVRAAIIAAAVACHADTLVEKGAADKSWRVRSAVAETLRAGPTAARETQARKSLTDPSPEVQKVAAAALREWPLEKAGPLWLFALAESGGMARASAAKLLAEAWEPAKEYVPGAPVERRAAVLERLQQKWRQDFPGSLILTASATSPVMAPAPAIAKALSKLSLEDREQRRQGASDLEKLSRLSLLPESALTTIDEQVRAEADPIVWLSILRTLREDARPVALQLDTVASSHPVTEVRRLACENLGRQGSAAQLSVLLASLQDPQGEVQAAAAQAVGRLGSAEHVTALTPLVTAKDAAVRLAAAEALLKLGSDQGASALERMSFAEDERIRRQVAVIMGESARDEFVATLVRLLDDRASVQRAALAGLEKMVGLTAIAETETVGAALPHDERIARFKKWHRQQVAATQK